jgi:hypothetical protein
MATEPNNQGNPSDNGNGEHIQTGGGAYIRGNVTSSGGVSVFGGTVGDVTYTDNRLMSPDDEATLKELFVTLHQQIDAATHATLEDQADAKEAAQTLEQELDKAIKDPIYKPSRVTMKGLIAAFKNVGAPVLNVALTILGFPPLGAAINAIAAALPDDKKPGV